MFIGNTYTSLTNIPLTSTIANAQPPPASPPPGGQHGQQPVSLTVPVSAAGTMPQLQQLGSPTQLQVRESEIFLNHC